MKLFNQGTLKDYLASRFRHLRNEVDAEPRDKLLNMNETEYIDYLVEKYKVDPLVLDCDQPSISDREEILPPEASRPVYDERQRQSYRKQIITYHVPYSGNSDLLQYSPTMREAFWEVEVQQNRDSISFDVVAWKEDPEEVSREAERKLSGIQMHAQNVAQQVSEFNEKLEANSREIVRSRKGEHLKRMNLLSSLKVPLKKAASIPETFKVPALKKKVIIKPVAPDTPYAPDPTLEDSVYEDILTMCTDFGIEFERHPTLYQNKNEEMLRDHFILVLSPQFDSVTGETFNTAGKTDILIRHEKSNIFVAECKIWGGMKAFHKAIDQVLSYLTWRDSKAAILCFIKSKELTPVLAQIETETSRHPAFVKYHGSPRQGRFNFEFHLPRDRTRAVRLAVLCFHFPTLLKKDNRSK